MNALAYHAWVNSPPDYATLHGGHASICSTRSVSNSSSGLTISTIEHPVSSEAQPIPSQPKLTVTIDQVQAPTLAPLTIRVDRCGKRTCREWERNVDDDEDGNVDTDKPKFSKSKYPRKRRKRTIIHMKQLAMQSLSASSSNASAAQPPGIEPTPSVVEAAQPLPVEPEPIVQPPPSVPDVMPPSDPLPVVEPDAPIIPNNNLDSLPPIDHEQVGPMELGQAESAPILEVKSDTDDDVLMEPDLLMEPIPLPDLIDYVNPVDAPIPTSWLSAEEAMTQPPPVVPTPAPIRIRPDGELFFCIARGNTGRFYTARVGVHLNPDFPIDLVLISRAFARRLDAVENSPRFKVNGPAFAADELRPYRVYNNLYCV